MLQAKVKPEYRFGNSLQAFSRHEFIKSEWRDVPAGFEEQARAHEWLETRDRPQAEPEVEEAPVSAETLEEESLPTSERLLDEMLDGEEEEVKETRRGRGGRRKSQ